jgi:hypothetical protein
VISLCAATALIPSIATIPTPADRAHAQSNVTAYNCPNNRFTNGDFTQITGNPGSINDQDINLATGWGPIWSASLSQTSLADLYSATEDQQLGGGQQANNPNGNYAAMWISNRVSVDDKTWREGMFNKLATPISINSGTHQFKFISQSTTQSGSGKGYIGVYGVNRAAGDPLPAAPSGLTTPSNINLFGASKTILLAKVEIPANIPHKTWVSQTITFPTSNLGALGQITHIMVTRLDQAEGAAETTQLRYMAFDNFCMQTASDAGITNTDPIVVAGEGKGGDSNPRDGATYSADTSTCCPPASNFKLSKMLTPVQATIADDYYLKFTLDPQLDAQMTAYGAYLKTLDPSITTTAMAVRAFDGGTGNAPVVSGGPLEPEKHFYWHAGNSNGILWPAGDLFSVASKRPVNNWTVVEIAVWQPNPNRLWSMDCSIRRIAFRPQIAGARAAPGTRGFVDYKGPAPATTAKRPMLPARR